jgi:4-carboxymuconolactone decarboxylase
MADDELRDGFAMRRSILGDAHVDRSMSNPDETEFQEYITRTAWGVWARDGLTPRDRSLLVMAMTAALGRMEEFTLHARNAHNAGVTDDEIDAVTYQIAAYCGVPAGIAARRAFAAARAERDAT